MMSGDALQRLLQDGVARGVFPSSTAAVFHRGALVAEAAAGTATPDTIFDLASLTKALATTPAIARLIELGLCDLDDEASRWWPGFGENGKDSITLGQLLAHTSGLAPFRPYFLAVREAPATAALFEASRPTGRALTDLFARSVRTMLKQLEQEPLEAPPGARASYCDTGFIALGHLIERIAREPLDAFTLREVFEPLRLPSLGYRPIGMETDPKDIAPTGVVRPREPAPGQEGTIPPVGPTHDRTPRPGEVDDDNAYALGGVAGHAGLFGTARDVAAFGQAILEELDGACRIAAPALWEIFVARHADTRALGFDTPSAIGSSAGDAIARSRAFGHLGFTGTSLWVDRDRALAIALLSNRTHPGRGNDAIRAFRPAFHDQVVKSLERL